MPGRIILLTGPPGAGKTTVAPLLCANAPGPLAVHLETDAFYRSIKKGWLAPWTPESHGQNQVVVRAMVATAVTYAVGGYEVVADGIVTGWVKQLFVEGAKAAGVTLDLVVLIPDLATAAARAMARTHDPIPDYGPYTATAYPGATVDCAKPAAAPVATETIGVKVSKVDPLKYPMTLQTVSPLSPQLAIAFDRHRMVDDLNAPYSDETVALNHITTYVMNTDEAEVLALIVTKRQTIDIASQAGGGIAGGIAGALVGLDGIEVDLHFELCKNLLKPDSAPYCADVR